MCLCSSLQWLSVSSMVFPWGHLSCSHCGQHFLSLQISWQIFLLLLPSGLFIFGVVIYGIYISEGVFVEIGELFKGWGKVERTFHHISCIGWVVVHVQTSPSLTWSELLASDAVASVWCHISKDFVLAMCNCKGLTCWAENLEGLEKLRLWILMAGELLPLWS